MEASIRKVIPLSKENDPDIQDTLAAFVDSGRLRQAFRNDTRFGNLCALGWTQYELQQEFSLVFLRRVAKNSAPVLFSVRYLRRAVEHFTTDLLRKASTAKGPHIDFVASYAKFEKPPQLGDTNPVTAEDSAEQLLAHAQTLEAIERAVSKMPPQRARVCALFIVNRLDAEQIAERLGITVKTVEAHLLRITRDIAAELAPATPSSSKER
jgi:RNA polymerase sigma factor (sigma-70 family)